VTLIRYHYQQNNKHVALTCSAGLQPCPTPINRPGSLKRLHYMRKQSIASKCVTDHMNEYNKLQMICISIIIYKSQMVNVEADKNLDLLVLRYGS